MQMSVCGKALEPPSDNQTGKHGLSCSGRMLTAHRNVLQSRTSQGTGAGAAAATGTHLGTERFQLCWSDFIFLSNGRISVTFQQDQRNLGLHRMSGLQQIPSWELSCSKEIL